MYGGDPLTGQRPKTTVRQLANPVSRPSQTGELAPSATTTGSQGLSLPSAPAPADRLGTATWMCIPLMSCSSTRRAASATSWCSGASGHRDGLACETGAAR